MGGGFKEGGTGGTGGGISCDVGGFKLIDGVKLFNRSVFKFNFNSEGIDGQAGHPGQLGQRGQLGELWGELFDCINNLFKRLISIFLFNCLPFFLSGFIFCTYIIFFRKFF